MPDTPAALADPFLRLKAGDVPCPAPVFVLPEDSVARAAAAMASAGATAALVREVGGRRVLGIVTERDVLTRVVAAGLDPAGTPAASVMTEGLATVRADETLLEAFSRMVRRRVRRLVLLDSTGQPSGLLGEGELLAARGESPLAIAAEIDAAPDGAALARGLARVTRLAARCVEEGLDAGAVGGLVSELHDRLMARAWGLALEALRAAGRARGDDHETPAHALLVLGSQARREQYLATDMDLALAHAGGAEHAPLFADLGRRTAALLLEAGFPPCPRRIMPDSPEWTRGQAQWLDLAQALADAPDDAAVVTASILADMRPLPAPPGTAHGACDPALGARLAGSIRRRLAEGPLLLKRMALEAVRFRPPLGLFGGLSLTRDASGRTGIDVKRGGVFAITQGAKTLALAHGVEATGTRDRLLALGCEGTLSSRQAEGLCEALALLQGLRMRAQARALSAGLAPDNTVRPDELGALQAEGLRTAFKLTAELQDLLTTAFALRLLG
jgi:CBS domain-containing protein